MMDFRLPNKRRRAVVAAAVSAVALLQLLFATAVAQAAMDLVLADTPDIFFADVDLEYDGAELVANGSTVTFTDTSGTLHYILGATYYFGDFSLQARINSLGQMQLPSNAGDNTVTLTGRVPALGYGSGSLLTGDITAFDFGPNVFEFLYTITGGDAASMFGGIGAAAGLIYHPQNFPGNFAAPFSNGGGFGDTRGVVPEPASLVIWPLLGLGIVLAERRRRRRLSA
jgi:hypothetical protein